MSTLKRISGFVIIISAVIGMACLCHAQDNAVDSKIFLLRQAKQFGKTWVAVEAYLEKDILEVTVWVRMYGSKPRIDNVNLFGPGIGRLSCKLKQTLFATEEDDGIFDTEERAGLGTKKTYKKPKGALTKELYKFVIPPDKIQAGKKYEIRVRFIGMQEGDGTMQQLKFELKKPAGTTYSRKFF